MLDIRQTMSLPTPEIIQTLHSHSIIECGAGKGLWMSILRQFGTDIIGIDPIGEGIVQRGSHLDLAQYSKRLLLIVWPPDGTDLSTWIDIWGGRDIAICGDFKRFKAPEIEVHNIFEVPQGPKGKSTFKQGLVKEGK